MTGYIRERPVAALLAAVAVLLVGRLIDLQWHLTHDDFEGAADQIRAHLVLWIGVLMLLGVSALALRKDEPSFGYSVALAGAAFYVPIASWHFIEHANGSDPELPHILIALAYIAMLIGVIAVIVSFIRSRRAGLI